MAAAGGASRRSSASPTASRRRRRPVSTGRGRRHGETAATTRASSSTSRAASRRAVPAADYERVRDDLAARIAAIPDENGNPLGDEGLQARRAVRHGRGRRSRPDRDLRRSALALGRDDRRRRGDPHVRERHRPRRREPRAGRACGSPPARESARAARRRPAPRHRADGARPARYAGSGGHAGPLRAAELAA